VTEDELKFYRKRQLEVHEQIARERLVRADANLLAGIKLAKDFRKLKRK
jgi:hypothetical protein